MSNLTLSITSLSGSIECDDLLFKYLNTEDRILLKKWVSEFVSSKSELKNIYLGVIS